MFQAVEIDGQPYWDGGYLGNPAMFPLFYKTACEDILLVQINPIERRETPRTAREIQNRLNEITFNGTLLRELRAIEFVNRLIDDGKLSRDDYKRVLMHRIDGDRACSMTTRPPPGCNAEWDFFISLRDAGRRTAKAWLKANYDAIGERATLDLKAAVHSVIASGPAPGSCCHADPPVAEAPDARCLDVGVLERTRDRYLVAATAIEPVRRQIAAARDRRSARVAPRPRKRGEPGDHPLGDVALVADVAGQHHVPAVVARRRGRPASASDRDAVGRALRAIAAIAKAIDVAGGRRSAAPAFAAAMATRPGAGGEIEHAPARARSRGWSRM